MSGSVHSLDSFDSVDGLDVDAGYDSDEEYRLAQKEWEESLEQLQQLVSIVLLPFFGRWVGRKWSYWGTRARLIITSTRYLIEELVPAYARYLRLGLGTSFFVGARSPST
jgi:hypothetical protein